VKLAVGGVVVLGIAGAVGVPVYLSQRHDGTDTTTVQSLPVDPTPLDPPLEPTPFENESPAPYPTAPASVDLSQVASDPSSVEVARTLGTYFDGVDNRQLEQAYAVYTPAWRARIPFAEWADGVSTTDHSNISVTSITAAADGSYAVDVLFTSTQAPEKGARPGETCTDWSLRYTLERGSSTELPFLIASAKKTGFGSKPC
jgi:hypothetical protein